MELQSTKLYLTKILYYLGFSPQTAGYRYIKDIVFLYIEKDCLKLIDIYPAIAKSFSETPQLVEASVRNALKRANSSNLNKKLESLMGTGIHGGSYNVTVSEFFGAISVYLKYFWDGKSTDLPPLVPIR